MDKGTEFLKKLLDKAKQMTQKEFDLLCEKAKKSKDYGKYKIVINKEMRMNQKCCFNCKHVEIYWKNEIITYEECIDILAKSDTSFFYLNCKCVLDSLFKIDFHVCDEYEEE